ncbi:HupE/UreJ family protein [Microvirga brassicacearum]|nr:HupE/UreJ family protein [Microvirga brassicacearum]
MNNVRLTFLFVFATAASPALAHTGVGSGTSFLSGFLHPLSGADHILAIIAVGLWARLLGGRALVVFPASFLIAMLGGGVIAMAGWTLPAIEAGIAASILVLWALIIFRARPPILIGSGLCAVFAVAHGYAHGAELATGSNPAQYAAGFLLATAVLLLIGSRLPHLAGGIKGEA